MTIINYVISFSLSFKLSSNVLNTLRIVNKPKSIGITMLSDNPYLAKNIVIPQDKLDFSYARSSGPGVCVLYVMYRVVCEYV